MNRLAHARQTCIILSVKRADRTNGVPPPNSRKAVTMETKTNDAYEFIAEFFNPDSVVHERAGFLKLKEAFAEANHQNDLSEQDEQLCAALFEKMTRKKTTYSIERHLSSYDARRYENMTREIVDSLTSDPTSVSDIYDALPTHRSRGYYYAKNKHREIPRLVRECMRKMAENGLIGMMEVKTCGKCAIRLYYRR